MFEQRGIANEGFTHPGDHGAQDGVFEMSENLHGGFLDLSVATLCHKAR